MALTVGMRLGPYQILASLGAGGMGEVWRARDTRLDREVAVKVLPDAMARDSERLARFEREARVLAALNHPNIAQVYGLEENGELHALIMELVPGTTLPVPLPLESALDYARQIASALEAAHEKGITHRDLKPGNIMVTPDGVVKVLDFGLASAPPGKEASGEPSNSPTMTLAATQAGYILGTASYMSPEQAAGKVVDKRSDIWSFGVVLYEMITGVRMFEGETISHTLAHVLTKPVDVALSGKQVPPVVHTLLKRCLDRDVKSRLRDIGEARIALERCLADPLASSIGYSASAAAHPALSSSRTSALLPWVLTALSLAAAATSLWWQFRSPRPQLVSTRFEIPLPKGSSDYPNSFAFSPDGRDLAFTTRSAGGTENTQLWIRSMDSAELRQFAGSAGALFPFWSPDRRFLAFGTPEGLKKVSREGGASVLVSPHPLTGGTWNARGIILMGNRTGPILQVSEDGGEAKPALTLDASRQETSQTWPHFLPDGRSFLFQSRYSAGKGAVYFATLGSPETRKILDVDYGVLYSQGHLLYLANRKTLMAQPFDASRGKFTGPPFQVADNAGSIAGLGLSFFTASSDVPHLAYREGASAFQVSLFNRKGEAVGTVGPSGDYDQITLSPDGKHLALDRRLSDTYDVWILEISSGILSRATTDPANDRDPVFSPDGRQIVFTNDRLGMPHLYRKTLGGGAEELLYKGPDREASEVWLKEGSILFGNLNGFKYFLLKPEQSAEPRQILQGHSTVDEPSISPDEKWVTYGSLESGRFEAYVARFPQWDEQRQISVDGGMQPQWRRDGREIIYIRPDGHLMSVAVKPGSGSLELTSPVPLFSSPIRATLRIQQWAMNHNASRFYILHPLHQEDAPITVLLNWLPQTRK